MPLPPLDLAALVKDRERFQARLALAIALAPPKLVRPPPPPPREPAR